MLEVSNLDGTYRQQPFMTLEVAVVRQADGPFSDIRHLVEIAEKARQRLPSNQAQK